MVRVPWPLPLLSIALLLAACEQPMEPARPDADAAVLPATQSSKDFGDYVVHFNALTTDQLTPDVARRYGIVRSANRAILNVSILRKNDDAMGTPVSGSVSASAVNLTGQFKNITVREIAEGNAIYYIGEVAVSHSETLIFSVDVTPINETSRFSFRFMKQFFTE
jgi:hypothetical protein